MQLRTVGERLKSPDSILIQQAQLGNQDAFAILVQRYQGLLLTLIYHYVKEYDDACDVLQQVLLQFYLSLAILQTEKPLKGWLFQVARNRSIDHLRQKRSVCFSELERALPADASFLPAVMVDPSPLPDEVAEQHDRQDRLQRAIQALPLQYRRLIALRSVEHMSYIEIGKSLAIPEARARRAFHRAKLLLRTALETSS